MATIVKYQLERKAVTLEEAAQMLALSTITLRRAIRSGRLKAFRSGSSGGAFRITIDALDDFINDAYKREINRVVKEKNPEIVES